MLAFCNYSSTKVSPPLGSIGNSCAGSSPVTCTKRKKSELYNCRVRIFYYRNKQIKC